MKSNKNIITDKQSVINYNISILNFNKKYPSRITNSICSISEIGIGCKISDTKCFGNVSIGNFVSITGPGTIINSIKEKINIGSFTSIGQNVCIVDFNHAFNRSTSSFIINKIFQGNIAEEIITKGKTIIEEDVWIGSNSVITAGIKIGRGAVIGAGSIVTKDIPKYSIAFGNPAKIISARFSENKILFLEEIEWWKWDTNKILRNREFFETDIAKQSIEEIKNKIND
ncbi:Bacterial transferase hexapeptide repeat protein [Polaribacter dokdonensis DSW-5]|uniref:Bacterial transferase hexapeptide repeat protein n=1 Tax=Polaribacter dokdonensis DSW-5 TaxID=1300348 RepID=A0A0M9CE77_9FLAO|nr:Bacterial transferase hexapeptide repeat protein [Polaribacter dokdonensis DSW-5]